MTRDVGSKLDDSWKPLLWLLKSRLLIGYSVHISCLGFFPLVISVVSCPEEDGGKPPYQKLCFFYSKMSLTRLESQESFFVCLSRESLRSYKWKKAFCQNGFLA